MAELEQNAKTEGDLNEQLDAPTPEGDQLETSAASEELETTGEFVDEEVLVEEKRLPKYSLVETFDAAPISDQLREAINKIGWTSPTPVQGMCLPYSLRGRDVAGFAQTGTGKTGVFLITIAETILRARLKSGSNDSVLRAIVLAPTRELALQIQADAEALLNHLGIKSLAVFGGVDYDKQASAIKSGIDLILATPGRLKDYLQKNIVRLKDLELFVCDEADRMFDMGFIEDVKFFFERINPTTQKLLFSATTNDNVSELAFEYLEAPEYISVTPESMTPERITQIAYMVESKDKLKVLLGLFREQAPTCAIVFTNTKIVAEWLQYKLQNNGIEASLLTGDLPQRKRIALIQQIKEGKMKALIATDVASRGLHISNLTHVYNFDLPDEAANYVHRIGRTARAGASGLAISLVCEDYGQNLATIQDLIGNQIPIQCTWPDPAYLAIQDMSGSPYKDPTFKSNSVRKSSGDDKRRGRGEREERKGKDTERSGRNAKGDRQETKHPKERNKEHLADERGGKQSHGGPKKREHKKPLPAKSTHPTKIIRPKSATVPAAIPQQGLWSLIKKFFAAIFGKKPNT